MKYELFKRLNSNGSKLTPQEIRNAVYRGADSSINKLILELSQNKVFQKLTGLSEQKKRELYDQELVLRFIAFLNNIDKINQNTEMFLNDFMKENSVLASEGQFDLDFYRAIFNDTIDLIDKIGDEKIFRKNNFFVPADFEGIMIGVAQNIEIYRNNLNLLRDRIDQLKSDTSFKGSSGSSSNSKSRIRNRLKKANEIFSA